MKTERLVGLMCALADGGRTTIGQLAERFEVSKRTIARDLETLNRAGVPVVTFPGAGGGVGVAEGYRVRRSLLTESDAQNLHAALDGLRSMQDDDELAALAAKLVPLPPAEAFEGSELVIDLSSWFADDVEHGKFERLRDAVRTRRCARFDYVSRTGRKVRVVEPCKLVYKHPSWYLYALCRERDAFRLFKLKRMASLEIPEDTFEPRTPPPLDFASFGADILPASDDDPAAHDVVLAYRASDEFALTDKIDAQFLHRAPDDAEGEVRLRVLDLAWAARLAAYLGDRVRVVSPPPLAIEAERLRHGQGSEGGGAPAE